MDVHQPDDLSGCAVFDGLKTLSLVSSLKRSGKFNGAFSSREKARKQKRSLSVGYIVSRKVNGEMRYTVLSRKKRRGKTR
jgi:hypothetical protein